MQLPARTLQARHERLAEALSTHALSALALNPGPTLTYLTGLHFHLMERPVVAFFGPNTPVIILPALEGQKVAHLPFAMEVFTYSEDLDTWPIAFEKALRAAGLAKGRLGVEPRSLRFLELSYLQAAAPEAQFVSGEACVASLRVVKDAVEIETMRKATVMAEQAVRATLPAIRAGVTEQDIATELTMQLLRAGSGGEFPFPPIVAFGPNAANPHATPTTRQLAPGELVLLDWGANCDGYFSDLTRMFSLGEVADPELARIAAVTAEANLAAQAVAGPGVAAGAVDEAAREVITAAGYGDYFIHRTGHGLGMEAHEDPYIRSGNEVLLQPGMAFTIEPGIYLTGRGGTRIEDDMVITANGCESLSTFPRDVQVL